MKNSEIISEEHFVRPQLMYFQRAARTDKSVSAIRQIVSLKIPELIVQRINEVNEHLPDDIRLMGYKRVTQSFDAKNYCDARTYSYLMPSFALCPITEITKESYRITEDVLKLFNSTLKGFLGTHVFHNYTSGKAFKEDSSNRVIRFMNCSGPFFPCNQKEVEFIVVRVKGQSFLMHQIRKMIGMAIAVVKGFATEDQLRRSMEEPYMDVPKAPGLGLMLEEVHFDRYNRRFGGDGHHEPIEWESQSETIEKFKDTYIYPVVVETELKEKSMFNWLRTLSLHSFGEDPTMKVRHSTDNSSILTPQLEIHKKVAREDKSDETTRKRLKADETEELVD